ncbi:MATE family efflux transporter [Pseudoalteromonas piscicida]|uniref:Multidrug export protein MepA n=1 Tax=Pseudoalteromonas piscicida TaxID=43662 RepID=A0AAQ2IRP4_PSEO7|nr:MULTISPECIES: MATE family efflux transporter [Pseudoalteromonas]KJY93022.1 multidrug transporter MATE [Pseudoalteromonas piscicida]TMN36793.1 MATE family efflux transporter [Pseudoalteromonas piscicida]TMN37589.1 MATE family efflux transporter [Pseudoalteromonas piscicida]TMN49613.1 MATE family efflux transporter [Pseudoalteromonas piscicida]TMN56282.1 MATE family efflux transporter [Pseudoalteromonas piscicida]
MKDKNQLGLVQLAEMPILALFIRTCIPICIGLLVVGLYALVDGWFISRYVSEMAFGAVAMVYPLQVLMIALTAMVSAGMAATMTRLIGAKQMDKAAEVIGHGLIIGGIVSVVFLILGWLYPLELLSLLQVEAVFVKDALSYLQPLYLCAISGVLLPIVADMFRGQGKPQLMMLLLLVSAVFNILLDYLFIAQFGLGVAGAAYATITAQLGALVIALQLKRKRTDLLAIKVCWKPRAWLPILAIGMPILITQFCLGVQTAVVNWQLLSFANENWVVAHGMLGRIINFAILPAIAMLIAFQTIVGYNLAAGHSGRVRACTRVAFLGMTGFALLLTLGLMGLPRLWLSLFTEASEFLEIGERVFRSALWGMPLFGVVILASGFYQAQGDAKRACFYSALKVMFILVPLIVIAPHYFGLNGVFMALVGADFIAAGLTLILCWRHYQQAKSQSGEIQLASIN